MNLMVPMQEVEILTDHTVQVTISPHPLQSKWRTETVPAGMTVAEIVLETFGKRPCSVIADGEIVEAGERSGRIPRETVEIVGVPANEVSSILKTVAVVLVTVLAAIIAPVLAPSLTGFLGLSAAGATTLIAGVLTVAGSLAVNALFPASIPQLSTISGPNQDDAISPTYSIGGARNKANLYGPIPSVLGIHRVSPLYAANAFTENIGDDQYFRGLFCWGYGPLNISDIRIGETPLENFTDVEIEHFEGYVTDGDPSLYPQQVFQEDLNINLLQGVPGTRTTADDIDEIIVDIQAPNGLYRYEQSSGDRVTYVVTFQLLYKRTSDPSFTSWQIVTISGHTPQPIRRSYRLQLPRDKYDFRVIRTSSEYSGVDSVSENVVWSAMRSIRNATPIDETVPLALTALRIRGTSQLSGIIQTLNGVVSSKVKVWNGSSWVADTISNNPANLFRHVLQGPANYRPVADSEIDLDQLADWASYCAGKGFVFNQVRDFRSSVWSTLKDIASAGRASPVFVDGKWSVVWDDNSAPVVQHFTPANSSGFTGVRSFVDLPHAFRVRFVNEDLSYQQDERIVYDDGYSSSNATLFEGLEFPGVTDPDLIWKHARYHIAQLRLRRETYTLTTDFEHLAATRGDRVRVTHDVPKIGLGYGRVKAVAGEVITLTGDVTMEGGKSYSIRFRLSDGSTSVRSVVTNAATVSQVTLVADAGETAPQAGEIYQFGEVDIESVVCRIRSIVPGPDFTAALELVDDAPEIHNADTGTIPTYDPKISEPVNLFDRPPQNFQVVEFLEFGEGGLLAGVNLSWQPPTLGEPLYYQYQYKADTDTDWGPVTSVFVPNTTDRINDLQGGSYRFRVKAIYDTAVSDWAEEVAIDIAGPFAVPSDVDNFFATISGDNLILNWSAIPGILIRDYEVRFSPLSTGATWAGSAPLQSGITGNSIVKSYAKGSYLIKARTWRDIYSANPTIIVAGVEPVSAINVVETVTDDPAFAGTHDRTYYDSAIGGVILKSSVKFFSGGQFFTGSPFFSGLGREPLGYYNFADSIDLGGVITSRLTAAISVGGFKMNSKFFTDGQFFTGSAFFSTTPDQWNLTAQVRYTDDDPAGSPAWTAWDNFTVGDYTARAFEFRLKLESSEALVTPLVTSATFTLDMQDRVIAFEDIASTTSGVALTFDPDFLALKNIQVTGQDMETGDYYKVTNKAVTGVTITFYDSGDNMINRVFDAQALGYGSIIT